MYHSQSGRPWTLGRVGDIGKNVVRRVGRGVAGRVTGMAAMRDCTRAING